MVKIVVRRVSLKMLVIVSGVMLVLNSGLINITGSDFNNITNSQFKPQPNYTPHAPIRINSNADFNIAHGVTGGNGTQGNPWRIENYEIIGVGFGCCMYIGNTTQFFSVKNCYLHDASGTTTTYFQNAGLLINNAINGILDNNSVMSNDRYGIVIWSQCHYVQIQNNTCNGNTRYGIMVWASSFIIVSDNIMNYNSIHGLYVQLSSDMAIDNNHIESNAGSGIHFYEACNNVIVRTNNITSNNYGINFDNTANTNTFIHNIFYYNTVQARDIGSNSWDDGYPSGGNYWSSYTGPDLFSGLDQNIPGSDGIGDVSYPVTGGTNVDHYPWMYPSYSPPTITLLYPTGKDIIENGPLVVAWNATDNEPLPPTSIDLYKSDDGGTSWSPLATGLSNDGCYEWETISEPDGVDYVIKIKVTDIRGQTSQDISENPFSIDNIVNDQWHLQVQSSITDKKDLDMKPVELSDNICASNISSPGPFMIGGQRYISTVMTQVVNVQGTWTFSVWGRMTTSQANGKLYARVYSYDGGSTTLLFQTSTDDELVGSYPSWYNFGWTYVAPNATVPLGQRIVVEIWLNATAGHGGTNIQNLATRDIGVAGTVSGTYLWTQAQDDLSEDITEVVGGTAEFVNQTFAGSYPPTGWAENDATGNWNQVATANAGGTAPEARFHDISQSSTWRLFCGPINTAGYSSLMLRWANFFDDFGPGVTVKVQTATSPSGPWTDSNWYINSGGGNVGPGVQTTTLTSGVGSTTFYFSFSVIGNAYELDYWYVDNVVLQGALATSNLEHKWAITVPAGKSPYTFRIDAHRTGGGDNENFTFAYSTNNVTFIDMVTVTATSDTDAYQTYSLPSTLSGAVYIRVRDLDRVAGHNNLDIVRIDHMYIESVEGGPQMQLAYDYGVHQSYVRPALPMGTPIFSITVVAGWNLVSTPLIPANTTLPGVLIDSEDDTLWDRVMWYDSMTPSDPWKQYNTAWPVAMNDLTTIDVTRGVWVYVTTLGDGHIIVGGAIPTSTSVPLRAGWNLVGYPTLCTNMTVGDAFWSTGVDIVEVFDPARPYLTRVVGAAYVMKPGEGYWVHASADTVWVVDW